MCDSRLLRWEKSLPQKEHEKGFDGVEEASDDFPEDVGGEAFEVVGVLEDNELGGRGAIKKRNQLKYRIGKKSDFQTDLMSAKAP